MVAAGAAGAVVDGDCVTVGAVTVVVVPGVVTVAVPAGVVTVVVVAGVVTVTVAAGAVVVVVVVVAGFVVVVVAGVVVVVAGFVVVVVAGVVAVVAGFVVVVAGVVAVVAGLVVVAGAAAVVAGFVVDVVAVAAGFVVDVVEAFSPHPANIRTNARLTKAQSAIAKEAVRFIVFISFPRGTVPRPEPRVSRNARARNVIQVTYEPITSSAPVKSEDLGAGRVDGRSARACPFAPRPAVASNVVRQRLSPRARRSLRVPTRLGADPVGEEELGANNRRDAARRD